MFQAIWSNASLVLIYVQGIVWSNFLLCGYKSSVMAPTHNPSLSVCKTVASISLAAPGYGSVGRLSDSVQRRTWRSVHFTDFGPLM
mmetsp:Transcript_11204/g.22321  ORF Transcript_11204/g.22321 Transcript_11204/m.22321 type:complete len:86 (+) Transcript_11204:879-1136(+)